MDGATNNDTFNTGFVLRPPPDAIEEFKILTHAFGAEYGRNAGSVVNVVTKSGSNTLTGVGVGVQPRRRAAGPQLLRPRQPAQAGAEAEPVRRRGRRSDRQEPRCSGSATTRATATTPASPHNVVVLSEAQRAGNFGTHHDPRSADRPAVPEQHHSRQPHQPGGGAGCSTTSCRCPTRPATATSSRRRSTTSATSSAPASTTSSRQNQSLLLRYMRAETERTTPKVIAPVDQQALATLQDFMASHNYVLGLERHQPGARVDQPHQRQPGGDERPQPARLRHQLRQHQPAGRRACRRSPSPGFFGARHGRRSAIRSSRS